MHRENKPQLLQRLAKHVTERNVIIFIFILFIVMTIWVASVPYDPMKWDKADATTNVIWTDYYSQGIYEVPFSEWKHKPTQSVVVEHDGEYVVVNEKGPGHVIMILPFYMLGLEILFGPFMIGIAVLSTYMLGRRLMNWRVGAIAAILVMTNLTVIVMWHRFWWTDASTMHLLILSMWLLVEGNYRLNKNRSLLSEEEKNKKISLKTIILSLSLALGSGLALGASITTRYPIALVLFAPVLFLFVYYLKQNWQILRKRQFLRVIRESKYLYLLLLCFFIGIILIIIPLMSYNNEYFGGPFKSGYDATPVTEFRPDEGLAERNQSTSWASSTEGKLETILDNTYDLTPVFLNRMPYLLFLPFGIIVLRRSSYLWLLLPWIIIIFLTYMSLSWVSMYAHLIDVVHEPRYFMPALPAITLFAGVAIDKIAFRKSATVNNPGKNSKSPNLLAGAFVILIVFSLVFVGIIPAANHFQDLRELGVNGPSGGPRDNAPGPRPEEYIEVNTDQLLLEPKRFVETFVSVKGANITWLGAIENIFWIRSTNAKEPDAIQVHMVGFGQEELDKLRLGVLVDVKGFFQSEEIPNQPIRYYIGVKNGTLDSVELSIKILEI
ncbi:hypothetical protein [[Eubacterium] cellulosolvens]